jgi:hypothetical protein
MSYEDRDTYGMYKNDKSKGPGPELMGEKLFAVPWNALTLDTVDQPPYPEHRWGIYSYTLSIGYIVPLEVT